MIYLDWFIKNVVKAKNIFWNNLGNLVSNKYEIQPVTAIDKLTNFYSQAIHSDGSHA